MPWNDTDQPIRTERDLVEVEDLLDTHTPVNVKLRQVPRLISALRRAWRTRERLRRENLELRRQLMEQPTVRVA